MYCDYTDKEKELLSYIRRGYKMYHLGYHPDEQRASRQQKIDAAEQYANKHKHNLRYLGYPVSTVEEYLFKLRREYEYEDNGHIKEDLKNARAWARSANRMTAAERDRENAREVAGGIGDVVKIIAFIFLVLLFAPAWPLLILLVIGGGIMGAGRWSGWF